MAHSGTAPCSPCGEGAHTAMGMLLAPSRARMISMKATGYRLWALVFSVLAAGCGGKFAGGVGAGGGGEGSGSGAANGPAGTFGAALAPAAEDGGAVPGAPTGNPSASASTRPRSISPRGRRTHRELAMFRSTGGWSARSPSARHPSGAAPSRSTPRGSTGPIAPAPFTRRPSLAARLPYLPPGRTTSMRSPSTKARCTGLSTETGVPEE
jgi:hypothetical protein